MTRALPPIPDSVPSILGPVPCALVQDLRDKKDNACFGIWRADVRDVRLEREAHRVRQWQTYWHEWMHIVLTDAGVELSEAQAEVVCDAVANARVREMLDG